MSWPSWPPPVIMPPATNVMTTAVRPPNAITPAPVAYNSALPAPSSYTPAQFTAMSTEQQYAIQSNWQQWQTYYEQYAQWRAQYGEQYQREMEAKMGSVAPQIPFTPQVPQITPVIPVPPPSMFTAPPPNIMAVTSQPPPPPPPPEQDKKTASKNDDFTRYNLGNKLNENFNFQAHNFSNINTMGNFQNQKVGTSDKNSQNENFNYQNRKNFNERNDRQNLNTWQQQTDNQQCRDGYSQQRGERFIQEGENKFNQQRRGDSNQQQFGCNSNQSQNTKDLGQKSPEEKNFDEQFRKWEEEFENWKKQNANHPDKKAYREYEMKFEDCRRKLLERREQMIKRKMHNAPKTATVEPLTEISTEISNDNKPENSTESKKEENVMDEIIDLDKDSVKDDLEHFEDVDKVDKIIENVNFLTTTKSEGIPGLDLIPSNELEETNENNKDKDVNEVIDLDTENKSIPPVIQPIFNTNAEKSMPTQLPKKEIPSLLSQIIQPPTFSPPHNTRDDVMFGRNPYSQTSNNLPIKNTIQTENVVNRPPQLQPVLSNNQIIPNNAQSESLLTNSDQGMPAGVAELANALSNPNVLALLSAALGGNMNINQNKNFNDNILSGGGNLNNTTRISPWAAGHEPFQNRQFDRFNSCIGGGTQFQKAQNICTGQIWQNNRNSSDFGLLSENKWKDKNNDLRGNNWPERPNSSGNFDFNNAVIIKDQKSHLNRDDIDMRDPLCSRGNHGMGNIDEHNKNSDILNEKEIAVPFQSDRDERKHFNPFADNKTSLRGNSSIENERFDRGRSRDRRNDYQDNRRFNNRRNDNFTRDRSRSSNRFEDTSNQVRSRNPFKTGVNDVKRISPLLSRNKQQIPDVDDFFRPTQVFDYKNKPLSGHDDVDDIKPTKVVDYGHKSCDQVDNTKNDFFPIKTIDYGHSSSSSGKFEIKSGDIDYRFDDFHRQGNNLNERKGHTNRKTSGSYDKNQYNCGPWTRTNEDDCNNRFGLSINHNNPVNVHLNIFETKNIDNVENKLNSQHLSKKQNNSGNCGDKNLEAISDEDNDFGDYERTSFFDKRDILDNVDDNEKKKTLFPIQHQINSDIKKNINNENLFPTMANNYTITVDEILLKPGRISRPKKIVIILRGPPGSGKTYVAKLIKEKEVEMGGSAPRLLSIDDYFMLENDKEEISSNTGRKITKKEMVYEYEKDMEVKYFQYLLKSYKKTITDNLFDFIIVDCINNTLRDYNEFYNFAKSSKFTPYTIDLICNLETCLSHNVHNRSENDIKNIIETWSPTPDHYMKLDITSLLQSAAIPEVEMEDISDADEDNFNNNESKIDEENENFTELTFLRSKWDAEPTDEKLARLDGISKPLNKNTTIEDYLQIEEWEPPQSNSNSKKRVRWADIEEKRAQDKMRAIGFVVGQTDWNRMMDPTEGSGALTKTKFIEKIGTNKIKHN